MVYRGIQENMSYIKTSNNTPTQSIAMDYNIGKLY